MDRIWSPWRYQYINSGSEMLGKQQCVFCDLQNSEGTDEEKRIVFRGKYNFIVLNIFPYTSGHALIVPYDHIADFDALPAEIANEYVHLGQMLQSALRMAYKPDGFNIGINQGSAAGAGVADHVHMHVVPRWVGDANFMSTIGETRVLPEELSDTWRKLRDILASA